MNTEIWGGSLPYHELKAENERLKAELSDCQYWRERHSKDAEIGLKASAEKWDEIQQLKAELEKAQSTQSLRKAKSERSL